jgi:hypothetical protein
MLTEGTVDQSKAPRESTRSIAYRRRLDVLKWVHRWGASTRNVLNIVGKERGTRNIAARMAEKGLLEESIGPGGVKMYTLSNYGLEIAVGEEKDLFKYPEADPLRGFGCISGHNVAAQLETAKRLSEGQIDDYLTERMAQEGDRSNSKRPDVIWATVDGRLIAVEVESSPKWGRAFDQFIYRVIHTLLQEPKPKFDGFVIMSQSQALLDRYKEGFAPGMTLTTWTKNAVGQWEEAVEITIPEGINGKVAFLKIQIPRIGY